MILAVRRPIEQFDQNAPQVRRYGWSARTAVSRLADFKKLVLRDHHRDART